LLIKRQLTLNALQFLVLTTSGCGVRVGGMARKIRVEYPGAIYGEERSETAAKNAEGIVLAELKRINWDEAELAGRAKGDLIKVKLAARLRAETLVTVNWIAQRLQMGTAGYVNNRLYRWRRGTLG